MRPLGVLVVLLALVSPVLAEDRDPLIDGAGAPGKVVSVPPDETPAAPDRPGLLSWPWAGTIRSPEWTQDRSYFPFTRFWLLDAGRVEVDVTDSITVTRHQGNRIRHDFTVEGHAGLVPHLALGVTENFFVTPTADLGQEGNRIELRFAPFDYGLLPLNPAVLVAYHPRHEGEDSLEVRVLAGGELWKGFQIVGNGFYEQETGGDKNGTWGFTAAAGYELLEGVVRVGGELRMAWHFRLGHDQAFHTYSLELGPSFAARPLALLDKRWGRHLKLQATWFFGVNDRTPMFDAAALVGYEF